MLGNGYNKVALLFLVVFVGLFLVSGCDPPGPTTYTLTVQISGEGSVNPSIGTHTYDEGTVVDITATPSEDWEFKEWVGDVAKKASAKTTVVMNKDQMISAVFVEKEDPVVRYTLTMQVYGQGSVNPSIGTYTYDEGTVVDITATPSEGWEFKEWVGDVENPDDSSTTVTMDSHKTVTAVFSSVDSEIIRLRDLGPEGDLQDPNNVYTIIDNTNLGYWSVSLLQSRLPGELSNNDTYTLTINENNYAFTINPFNNDMFEVNVRDIYTIEEVRDGLFETGPPLEIREHTLTMHVDGQGTVEPPVGTHTYDEDTVVNISATPASGWAFKEWIGDVADLENHETSVVMDGDKDVTAVFEKKEEPTVQYSLTIHVEGLGVVEPSEGHHTFEEGTIVELTATPAPGWAFKEWIGNVENPYKSSTTVTMDSHKTVKSVFYFDDMIEFEDPNLEQAIRRRINKPEGDLFLSDVIGLTSLDLRAWGIVSLEGLQYLQSLIVLYFSRNEVSDLTPLENLTNLIVLEFSQNQVSDLRPLENLTNLTTLQFAQNQVSDLTPLQNLTNLEVLEFYNNQVSDIHPLQYLTGLLGVNFRFNQVSDLTPLQNMTNLVELDFWNNQVSDISSLQNMTNLRILIFSTNKVSDLTPLQNLTSLKWLRLESNEVSDITPLVANVGFGHGDHIYMQNNYLDLTEGSQNMNDIKTLISRSVHVQYTPQRDP